MKKDILFIMNNLNVGGAEKALVSLLQSMDYSKYNVDLFLIKKEGAFLNQVPAEVHILPPSKYFAYFDMSVVKAIIENLKAGRFKIVLYRVLAGFIFKTEPNLAIREQKVWKYLKKVMLPLVKEYDVAIGYLEKTPNYFCVDKVKAKKKIGYIHTDYAKIDIDTKIDSNYLSKLNFIFTVSNGSKESLKTIFPNLSEKIKVIYNIIPRDKILNLSTKPIQFKKKGITIVSIGRLDPVKGYDLAIKACKILVEKDYDIYWYIIGEGNEKINLEKLIERNKLNERFLLLGAKVNPYPYLKQSDIFVHSAKFEGYGIVVIEAKILNRPIVITNFETSNELIHHNSNGLIASKTPSSIAQNIEMLIKDKTLKNKFVYNLQKEVYNDVENINKFDYYINL